MSYFLGFFQEFIHLSEAKYVVDLLHETHMFNASHVKPLPTPMCATTKLFLHDSALFVQPSLYQIKYSWGTSVSYLEKSRHFLLSQ